MTCYEATRQYQAAREAQRRLLMADTSVSFTEERDMAAAEVEQAHATMFDAWVRNTER